MSAASPATSRSRLDEVDLDVARVGPPGHGGDVDARLPPVTQPGAGARIALGERPQHPEHVVALLAATPSTPRLADGEVQGRRQRRRSEASGRASSLAGAPAAAHRRRAQCAEQHGLADPAQPGEHQRPLGPSARDPLEHDVERLQARRHGRPGSGGRWPAPGA
nr:hypothetical protein [Angustibacter aerolatus]